MSLSLFIARRLYREEGGRRQASRPAVLIAMAGIAIGLAVMIVAVSIIVGFKSEVRSKVAGFGSHLRLSGLQGASAYESNPVVADDSLMAWASSRPGVKHVQRYSMKPGMLKTDDAFMGMMLKGVGPEYDLGFLRRHLVEGEVPQFSDTASAGRVLVSRAMAGKLRLKPGDKLDTYYLGNGGGSGGDVRARRLQVAGIYETNFTEYDNLFILADLCLVNRLNGWKPGQVSGLEVELRDYGRLDAATWELGDELGGYADRYGAEYCVRNVEQLNPQLFAWLGILDVNVWVILALITAVAGFIMISGLLILILERTQLIGTLKALGATDWTVRRIFLYHAMMLVARGMLWGNVIGLGLCALQVWTGIVPLDPESYYTATVPVAFHWGYIVLLNAGALAASLLMMLGPSVLASRISPATIMRYE